MILACEETFYVLRFSRENYIAGLNAGQADEDGVEAAFEVVTDINESVRTGQWVGDCFIYTNSTNRLNYLVGDQTYTVSHFDQPMYLLGYLPRDGKAYVADKDVAVTSYALSLSVVEYQTLVLRGDMETAAELLEDIPDDQKNKIARFLEGQGHKELALEVATDLEQRFDLALALNNLPIALDIAREADVEHRWKTVGDAALTAWDLALAEECFVHAKDLGSLLLLHSSTGNAAGLRALAEQAEEAGSHNIAFSSRWQVADVDGCLDLLVRTKRVAEAVFLAQSYRPSRAAALVAEWKTTLEKAGKAKVSRLLAMPPTEDGGGDADLFEGWADYLKLETEAAERHGAEGNLLQLDRADDEDETEGGNEHGHGYAEDEDGATVASEVESQA